MLTFALSFFEVAGQNSDYTNATIRYGGLVRLDSTAPIIFLTFTGGDYSEGTCFVQRILRRNKIQANFFFTGDFYRKKGNTRCIKKLVRDDHYLGAHSDKHLLYATWEDRDSLLVSKAEFKGDLMDNYAEMREFGIEKEESYFFMPPYEWYNDSISIWTEELGLQLVNFTPGTRSNADYTTPDMGDRYVSSADIMKSIFSYERNNPTGLNGFILLLHVGTDSKRTDKFYYKLEELVSRLRTLGYRFSRIDK